MLMNRIVLPGILLSVLAFGQTNPQIQQGSAPLVSIERVRSVPQIYVSVKLRSQEKQMFVPFCSKGEGGPPFLCTLGVHLQVQTKSGWRAVSLKTTSGVPGGAVVANASGRVISSNETAVFDFEFSKRFYSVTRGQQLRLIVDVWPDEVSMRKGQNRIQLESEPFECP